MRSIIYLHDKYNICNDIEELGPAHMNMVFWTDGIWCLKIGHLSPNWNQYVVLLAICASQGYISASLLPVKPSIDTADLHLLFLNCRFQFYTKAGKHHPPWIYSGLEQNSMHLMVEYYSLILPFFYRLEREEMLGWTKLLCLKAKLLEGMENKYWAGMYTGLGNFLISSECYPSFSQLLVSMSAQWYILDVYFILFYKIMTIGAAKFA